MVSSRCFVSVLRVSLIVDEEVRLMCLLLLVMRMILHLSALKANCHFCSHSWSISKSSWCLPQLELVCTLLYNRLSSAKSMISDLTHSEMLFIRGVIKKFSARNDLVRIIELKSLSVGHLI